jgi:hypothetical protein
MRHKIELPHFQEAIRIHGADLPDSTLWRYANGLLPGFVLFIAQRPELAKALAADANDLALQRETVTQKGDDQ